MTRAEPLAGHCDHRLGRPDLMLYADDAQRRLGRPAVRKREGASLAAMITSGANVGGGDTAHSRNDAGGSGATHWRA